MMKSVIIVSAVVAAAVMANPAAARDQIRVAGSSTVFPFTSAVAETFGRQGKFKTPVVESTGTGGGLRLFCNGVGVEHPDVANASRRITKSEYDTCAKNGVTNIIEVKIGFDGIVIADSVKSSSFDLTRKDLWLGLAKQVPVDGKLAPNPYKTWNQVNPTLPARKIEVLGPPPTSGTRDSFVELVMDAGCKDFAEIKALPDAKARSQACGAIREDGGYIEAGENDNLIVQKLVTTPDALGIFGFSFYDQNRDKVKAHTIEGVKDEIEEISSGKYPIARDLYFYIKGQHIGVIPGLKEFVAEYVSEKAMGKDGYLSDKGLIPLVDAERKKSREAALAATPLAM